METSEQTCRTFFDFLRRQYRLNNWRDINLTLHVHPVGTIYREKWKLDVFGYATCVKNKVEIHIATGRGIVEVYKTIAHEYKHCMQRYNEGTWIGTGLCPIDSPLEAEADAFAEEAFAEFLRMYAPKPDAAAPSTAQV